MGKSLQQHADVIKNSVRLISREQNGEILGDAALTPAEVLQEGCSPREEAARR